MLLKINYKLFILYISIIIFIFFILLFLYLDYSDIGFQFITELYFFETCFLIGIDSISILFILLTSLIVPLCLLFNWNSNRNVNEDTFFFIVFLLLECLLILVFMILELVWFYFIFEFILIPFYYVVVLNKTRQYSRSNKQINRTLHSFLLLFFYTIFGSLIMLIGILVIYILSGTTIIPLLWLFDFSIFLEHMLWISFFISFGIKIPIVPLHLWLPEAHVILAAILLKIGLWYYCYFFKNNKNNNSNNFYQNNNNYQNNNKNGYHYSFFFAIIELYLLIVYSFIVFIILNSLYIHHIYIYSFKDDIIDFLVYILFFKIFYAHIYQIIIFWKKKLIKKYNIIYSFLKGYLRDINKDLNISYQNNTLFIPLYLFICYLLIFFILIYYLFIYNNILSILYILSDLLFLFHVFLSFLSFILMFILGSIYHIPKIPNRLKKLINNINSHIKKSINNKTLFISFYLLLIYFFLSFIFFITIYTFFTTYSFETIYQIIITIFMCLWFYIPIMFWIKQLYLWFMLLYNIMYYVIFTCLFNRYVIIKFKKNKLRITQNNSITKPKHHNNNKL